MIKIDAKKEIENVLDDLIVNAQKIVKETKLAERKMKPAQLRNLLELISATNSKKAIEVFIQYQMGRKETRQAWADSGFGRELIGKEIPEMERKAEEIARKTKGDKKEILIEILKLYIGYLNRYFVYLSSLSGREEES